MDNFFCFLSSKWVQNSGNARFHAERRERREKGKKYSLTRIALIFTNLIQRLKQFLNT